MSLFKSETKRYVVEETMGDNTVRIKVKFVTYSYFGSRCTGTTEVFDNISFNDKETAERYAKYAIAPSAESKNTVDSSSYSRVTYDYYATTSMLLVEEPGYMNSKSNSDDHGWLHDDNLKRLDYRGNIKVYDIKTPYNNYINEINDTLTKLEVLKDERYVLAYLTYNETYTLKKKSYIVQRGSFTLGKMKKSEYSNKCYCDIISLTMFDELKDAYESFKEETTGLINEALEKERKKRLAETVIKTDVTNVDNISNIKKETIISELSEADKSRNELIKSELARVSEYANLLKSLLR